VDDRDEETETNVENGRAERDVECHSLTDLDEWSNGSELLEIAFACHILSPNKRNVQRQLYMSEQYLSRYEETPMIVKEADTFGN
jgi:hypothetical protein